MGSEYSMADSYDRFLVNSVLVLIYFFEPVIWYYIMIVTIVIKIKSVLLILGYFIIIGITDQWYGLYDLIIEYYVYMLCFVIQLFIYLLM